MMDTQRREFVPVKTAEEAARVNRPVLSIGEVVELKGVQFRVLKMKNGGRLRIEPAGKTRIGFATGEPVSIKGVVFRVTFDAGKIVGMRMIGS